MTTVIMAERQRGRQRTRPRANARGNFITIQKFATVYSLTFDATDANYITWKPYIFPSTKAIGYIDAPAPKPVLVPVGPVSNTESVPTIVDVPLGSVPVLPQGARTDIRLIPSNPVTIPVLDPLNLPKGTNPTQAQPFKAGQSGSLKMTALVQQIFNNTLQCKEVLVIADDANAGDVWLGYNKSVAANNGQRLKAGKGLVLAIDDVSNIFLLGTVAGDFINWLYNK